MVTSNDLQWPQMTSEAKLIYSIWLCVVRWINMPIFSSVGVFVKMWSLVTFVDLQWPQMTFEVKNIYGTLIHVVQGVYILKTLFLGIFVNVLLMVKGIVSRPSHLLCPVRHESKLKLWKNYEMNYNFGNLRMKFKHLSFWKSMQN